MDIESIEMKAAIDHNHDVLTEMTAQQKPGLKKRVMEFLNKEIMVVTEKALAARENDEQAILMECLDEVEFLDDMADAVGGLPD